MTISFDLSALQQAHQSRNYIETGLGYCDVEDVSLKMAIRSGFHKCVSVELDPRFVETGKQVFAEQIESGRVKLICGDSSHLGNFIEEFTDESNVFFLDAHVQGGMGDREKYERVCPLINELDAISKLNRKDNVILIDDLRIITSCCWGDYQGENLFELIKAKVLEINPSYKFKRLDGHVADDVLYCFV